MPSSSDSSSNLLGSFFKGGAGDFSVSLICCFTSICPLINKIIINMAIQIFFFYLKICFVSARFTLAGSDVFLLEVCGGKGGEFPPLNSFRSAKSRRPRLEVLRRERPLE